MPTPPSSQSMPLLSILCLTYNHAAFIAQALDSFLAQVTAFEVEVVVGDDCSTDITVQIIDSFRPLFGSRLQVLTSPVNLGVTRNFRRTYRACRGKYIAICEGDDFWRGQNKLQAQVSFLESHPDYVMTYHDATLVERGINLKESQLPWRLRCDASSAELIATRAIPTLTVCFRNVLGDLPVELDQAPALDLCMWSLLGQHGKGKYQANIEPAGYRVHEGGIFSSQTERNQQVMTAQSLLCLARVYGRQGKLAPSDTVLLKAIQFASVPLGARAGCRLLGANFLSIVFSALQLVMKSLGFRRGASTARSPDP